MMPDSRPRRFAPRLAASARGAGYVTDGARCEFARRRAAVATRMTMALALAAAPAAAQPEPSSYTRAIAAGYKALTYCNGIFAAGRTPAQIDAEELAGIYPEYDAIVPTLTASVDRERYTVDVAYDATMPPRTAIWRNPSDGCVTFPIGSSVTKEAPAHPGRAQPAGAGPGPWPGGDQPAPTHPPAPLAARVTAAFSGGYGQGAKTTGVVVVHNGRIIAERYADGWGPLVAGRTWSVGKSIAGTLVGLAVSANAAQPNERAAVPEWGTFTDPRRDITLDNLLRMASGLHSDTAGNRTDLLYFGGGLVTQDATHWPLEARPGTRFRYANNDILLAVRSLRSTLGEGRYRDFPHQALFDPLGMGHTQAETDWDGNYILSSQVWSTARDLARLGQFWLQDGVWQGKRLLPEGWMRYMTTPSGPQPADGPGYGATMWLFGPAQGLPAGSYAAQGNRGQYVMVIPSAKLVVVRRGEDPGAARFDIAHFAADVLAATR